jgi:hypothetical protein
MPFCEHNLQTALKDCQKGLDEMVFGENFQISLMIKEKMAS